MTTPILGTEPVAEPVVGYRRWNVTQATLRSLNGTAWPEEGPLRARCHREQHTFGARGMIGLSGPHKTPGANCRCGVYAYNYEPETYQAFAHHEPYGRRFLFGAVLLSGVIVEHESGFRAERGWLHYLYAPGAAVDPKIRGMVSSLAQRYGVELREPEQVRRGAGWVRFPMREDVRSRGMDP